jgi:hypothetical protein
MIVLVCGGRDFDKKTLLDQTIDRLDQERKIVGLVHGMARGADTLAGLWMDDKIKEEYQACWLRRQACPGTYRINGMQYSPERWMIGYPANWTKYGKAAGPIRNKLMLDRHRIELVIAFPTGGHGTRHMIELANQRGVPTHVVSG